VHEVEFRKELTESEKEIEDDFYGTVTLTGEMEGKS
jgi:hypothetical protein